MALNKPNQTNHHPLESLTGDLKNLDISMGEK